MRGASLEPGPPRADDGRLFRRAQAAAAAIALGVFVYKAIWHRPLIEYAHLLVTWRDGLIKRALAGEIVSLFVERVPVALVYVVGGAACLIALALYLAAFRRSVGFGSAGALCLLCFTAGSPLFLKNFVFSVGYWDVLGAIVGFGALLLPVRFWAGALLLGAGVAALFQHHLHLLLYAPTVAAIWALRLYADRLPDRRDVAGWGAAALVLAAAFGVLMFGSAPPLPKDAFLAELQARAQIPLDRHLADIWYSSSLLQEMANTWSIMPKNLSRVPVYLAVLALHWPFFAAFRRSLSRLDPPRRLAAKAAFAVVGLGYLAIFVTVFDWSRWVANGFVCAVLLLHAVRMAGGAPREADLPDPSDPTTRALALAVCLIPKLGVTLPF